MSLILLVVCSALLSIVIGQQEIDLSAQDYAGTGQLQGPIPAMAAPSASIYDIPVRTIMGKEAPFGEFARGKVVLVVNGTLPLSAAVQADIFSPL